MSTKNLGDLKVTIEGKEIKGIVSASYCEGISSNLEQLFFEIATKTPYTNSEIQDFMCLTGKIDCKTILLEFSKHGIDLSQINKLAAMGLLNINKL